MGVHSPIGERFAGGILRKRNLMIIIYYFPAVKGFFEKCCNSLFGAGPTKKVSGTLDPGSQTPYETTSLIKGQTLLRRLA
jgi:hypothetical protein